MESDLYHAGWCWEDVCTDRFPLHAFVSFVLNAGPTTAVYHRITEGYGVAERLSARQLDALNMLVWTKSADAQKKPQYQRHRPKPTWTPGMEMPEPDEKEHEVMTIEDYMQRVGMG